MYTNGNNHQVHIQNLLELRRNCDSADHDANDACSVIMQVPFPGQEPGFVQAADIDTMQVRKEISLAVLTFTLIADSADIGTGCASVHFPKTLLLSL